MSVYTPGEVSTLLAIPSSSLRRYVAILGHLLSPGARKQRGRTFSESDISVIARVRELTQGGYTLEQIEPLLGDILPEVHPDELPPASALAIVQRIGEVQQSQQAQLRNDIANPTQAQEQQRRPGWKRLRGKKKVRPVALLQRVAKLGSKDF